MQNLHQKQFLKRRRTNLDVDDLTASQQAQQEAQQHLLSFSELAQRLASQQPVISTPPPPRRDVHYGLNPSSHSSSAARERAVVSGAGIHPASSSPAPRPNPPPPPPPPRPDARDILAQSITRLRQNLQEIKVPEPQPPPSRQHKSWTARENELQQRFEASRSVLMEAVVQKHAAPDGEHTSQNPSCEICGKMSSILRCVDCNMDLCAACDNTAHSIIPLHDRCSLCRDLLVKLRPEQQLPLDSDSKLVFTDELHDSVVVLLILRFLLQMFPLMFPDAWTSLLHNAPCV